MGLESVFDGACKELGIFTTKKEEQKGYSHFGEKWGIKASYQKVQKPQSVIHEIVSFKKDSKIMASAETLAGRCETYLVQMQVPVQQYDAAIARLEQQQSRSESLTLAGTLCSRLKIANIGGLKPEDVLQVMASTTYPDDIRALICEYFKQDK